MAFAVGCGVAPGAWAAGELAITVSGAPAQLITGDTAIVTARVTNNAPDPVNSLQVNFIPASDDIFADAPVLSGPGCQPTFGPAITCNVAGVIPPGASVELSLNASLPESGGVIVDAGARGYIGDPDAFPPNEVNAVQVRWTAPVEPKADVKFELAASSESVANGSPATIRGLITNTKSQGTAYGAQIKFSLPAGVEVVSRPPDCTGTALNLVCPVGDLGPNLSAQREVVLRTTTEGPFTVLGTAVWARPDTTPVDTQGQVTVTVLPPTDTTPVPDPTPTKPATPRAVTANPGSVAQGLPASGSCVRSRRLTLVLRSRGAWDPIAATIRVTGRKKPLKLKGSRAQQPFTLTLPRRGKVTLKFEVTLDNGRRYKATRSFRRC